MRQKIAYIQTHRYCWYWQRRLDSQRERERERERECSVWSNGTAAIFTFSLFIAFFFSFSCSSSSNFGLYSVRQCLVTASAFFIRFSVLSNSGRHLGVIRVTLFLNFTLFRLLFFLWCILFMALFGPIIRRLQPNRFACQRVYIVIYNSIKMFSSFAQWQWQTHTRAHSQSVVYYPL